MHEAFYSINVFMASSLARNRNSTMLITWDISRKNSFNNHIVKKRMLGNTVIQQLYNIDFQA